MRILLLCWVGGSSPDRLILAAWVASKIKTSPMASGAGSICCCISQVAEAFLFVLKDCSVRGNQVPRAGKSRGVNCSAAATSAAQRGLADAEHPSTGKGGAPLLTLAHVVLRGCRSGLEGNPGPSSWLKSSFGLREQRGAAGGRGGRGSPRCEAGELTATGRLRGGGAS